LSEALVTLGTVMIVDRLTEGQPPAKLNRSRRDVSQAQNIIYNHLLEIVKTWSPEDVLVEFRHLFIHHVDTVSSDTLPALYEIVFANQEQEFRNTLKRACYILINNWDIARSHKSIQQLIQLFSDPVLNRPTLSPTLKRLRSWLKNFVDSLDFQELRLFAARYENQEEIHWSQRYTSYLLVPQYINLKNPIEQREAARALSRQLKDKFKFELALYTARCETAAPKEKLPKNPTSLGDNGLRLIKMIVARRGQFSYANLANIFVNQTRTLNYQDFKRSLKEYLLFSVEHGDFVATFKKQLSEKLSVLYTSHNDKVITDALLLRTSNRVIEYLTTENQQEPSPLFVLLLSQGNPLTLVIVLLKIILVCKYARTHLEARIADLIKYYEGFSEEECQWVVNFFEIFNITMAIYAENVEYNLVDMNNHNSPQPAKLSLDACRIFSQFKRNGLAVDEPEALEDALEILAEEGEEAPFE
jgi:hypothetical protein